MAPKMDPSIAPLKFEEASRDKWIAACGPALATIFGKDMDQISPQDARKAYDNMAAWPKLKRLVDQYVPSWVFKSTVCRLVFCMLGTPFGTWYNHCIPHHWVDHSCIGAGSSETCPGSSCSPLQLIRPASHLLSQ